MPSLLLPDPGSPEFDTTADAAHALADQFSKQTANREIAGLLYKKPNGKYIYSSPLVGTGDHFEIHAGLPKGHTIAGILHTHPSDEPNSQMFSPDDIAVASHMNVPSFVKFIHDGSMRVYTPGQTKTQSMRQPGSAFNTTVARGDDVPRPQATDPTSTQSQQPLFAALAPLGNSGGTLGALAQVAQ